MTRDAVRALAYAGLLKVFLRAVFPSRNRVAPGSPLVGRRVG